MELTVFLKMLLDGAVFMTVGGFALNLAMPPVSGMTPALLFPALAAAVAFLLTMKEKNRYPALVLALPMFLFGRCLADYILLAILLAYAFFIIHKQMFLNDDGDFRQAFSKQLTVSILCCVVAGVTVDLRVLNDVLMPCVLVMIVSSVALMRILRHSRETIDSGAFKLSNTITVLLVCATTLLLTSGVFLEPVFALLHFLYNKVLLSGFAIFLSVAIRFLGLFSKLFAWLFGKEVKFYEDGDAGTVGAVDELLYDEVEGELPPIITYIVVGLLAIGAIYLAYKGLKAMAGRNRRFEGTSPFALSRQTIEVPKESRRNPFAKRSERESVRHQYRKFLRECLDRGFMITPDFDSQEISDGARDYFRGAPLEDFRQLYIKARYTEREITKEEARQAKNLYSEIKKSAEIEKGD